MSVHPLQTAIVAAKLCDLFYDEFGGKQRGRFQLSRDELKAIAGVQRMNETRLKYIYTDLMNDHSILMIEIGSDYFFVELNKVTSWRSISKKMLNKYRAKPRRKVIKSKSSAENEEKIFPLAETNEMSKETFTLSHETIESMSKSMDQNFSDSSIFSSDYSIESIEWAYSSPQDGEDSDSFGICDFTEPRHKNKINRKELLVSGIFTVEGGCLNWDIPSNCFERKENREGDIKIIFKKTEDNWSIRTDLYRESDPETHDKVHPLTLKKIDPSKHSITFEDEEFATGEGSQVVFYLRKNNPIDRQSE